jgi:hypothetical protein
MERTGVDRRPGTEVPVKKPVRTSRSAHLIGSRRLNELLLTSSSMVFAAFVAVTLLYGFDGYFFDGHYGSTAWNVFQQIGKAFRFE